MYVCQGRASLILSDVLATLRSFMTDYHLFVMFLLQLFFLFGDGLNFENNLYIIKYIVIVNMIMGRIILRGSVENNSN